MSEVAQARRLLRTLRAELLSSDSATLTLERWYRARALGPPARVVADRIRSLDKEPDTGSRHLLMLAGAEVLRHRRVRLTCGGLVLCEASNDYVPSRLTAVMNRVLETTDIPFGRAVGDLRFRRRTLSAEILWSPLTSPDGAAPAEILRLHAILELPDGTPISAVSESYRREVIGFAAPQ